MTRISRIGSVQTLVQLAEAKGVSDVVISPGSRNAPLILSFTSNQFFNCKSVLDERTAGFIALGMSQATEKASILTCTSGTAVLNYAPAIAEAFYQHIPLIAVTADRPKHRIDQGEGQSIRQENIMSNYVLGSFNLVEEESTQNRAFNEQQINEAFNLAISSSGPVHINVPLSEPLYEMDDAPSYKPAVMASPEPERPESLEDLKVEWGNSSRIMILVSQMAKSEKLETLLREIGGHPSIAVVTETTANLYDMNFISCIDRTLELFDGTPEESDFIPDLLITVGENIISKKLKKLFRKHKESIEHHWHFGQVSRDTFESLTRFLPWEATPLLREISKESPSVSQFGANWRNAFYKAENAHIKFLETVPYSDLKVVQKILDFIPDSVNLQMGNSSVVRYVQLFNQIRTLKYYGNRGVSGIEGCTSTALGMSLSSDKLTVLISGDQSFRYDSNGLSLQNMSNTFRGIVINNSGGNIFRIIPGPDQHVASEQFIEKHDSKSINKLVEYHECDYLSADDSVSLEKGLMWLFDPERKSSAVLEVFTPRIESPQILKSYFSAIKAS